MLQLRRHRRVEPRRCSKKAPRTFASNARSSTSASARKSPCRPARRRRRKRLAAIRSAHVRGCFSRYLQQIFKGEQTKGATPGPVTIQSGTPPAPGMSGSFGWRVTATFLVRGIKVPIYLDFLGFVDGPSQVTLLSSGLLRPFPASVQQHLFALLLCARAKSHKLMSERTWNAVDRFVEEQLIGADPALDAASPRAPPPGCRRSPSRPARASCCTCSRARSARARSSRSARSAATARSGWRARWRRAGAWSRWRPTRDYAEVAAANIARAGLAERRRRARRQGARHAAAARRRAARAVRPRRSSTPTRCTRPTTSSGRCEMSHAGSLIVADNVDPRRRDRRPGSAEDPAVLGSRAPARAARRRALAIGRRVSATTIQTVGAKGYDGFTLALVLGDASRDAADGAA